MPGLRRPIRAIFIVLILAGCAAEAPTMITATKMPTLITQKPCYSRSYVHTDFLRVHPGGFVVYHDGADAQRVIARLEAISKPLPGSEPKAILLLVSPTIRNVAFFVKFDDNGCASGQGRVPFSVVAEFLLPGEDVRQ